MKSIPEHEPTSRYYNLVGCIAECMLRCGEDNHHVHDVHNGYVEDMAPSLNVKDTDEEESENTPCTNLLTNLHQIIYLWT